MFKSTKRSTIPQDQSALLAEVVLNGLTAEIVVLNEVGEIILVNEAWHDFAVDHLPLADSQDYIGINYLTVCDQAVGGNYETASKIGAGIRSVMSGELAEYSYEYCYEFANLCNWFICRVISIGWYDGFRIVISHANINRRKLAELDQRVAAAAFETQEGIIVADANNNILRVNSSFTEITGYTSDEVIGQNLFSFRSDVHEDNFNLTLLKTIESVGKWKGDIWNRHKNGETYLEHVTITAVKDAKNNITNYVMTLAEITMSNSAAAEINNLAHYDPLTKLPNRLLFLNRLDLALNASASNGDVGALLFIDLDDFKTINDTLGHDIGDILLQQVAKRLLDSVRHEDTVARLGGDEFVVLLERLSFEDVAFCVEIVAAKILDAVNQPYDLLTHQRHSTVSIGITTFTDHIVSFEKLLQQADIAMYEAKKAGRNTFRFFNKGMQESLKSRASIETELRGALGKHQFQLYYQAQVDQQGSLVGAESLIRWTHPILGMVSPVDFIPLAEKSGLIIPIGLWVLDTACGQIKRWQQDPVTEKLILAVNVSSIQIGQPDFVGQVQLTIDRHKINPNLLKLELTENVLLENIEDTMVAMKKLRELGVSFSLDDFGTGYSSLQYLKRLPLSQLKIDRSFVQDLVIDSSDKAIVKTIIAMAKSLNLEVIAEGVETEEQRKYLHSESCMLYQGYLIGKPKPILEFEKDHV